jgi:hypothetical protein
MRVVWVVLEELVVVAVAVGLVHLVGWVDLVAMG